MKTKNKSKKSINLIFLITLSVLLTFSACSSKDSNKDNTDPVKNTSDSQDDTASSADSSDNDSNTSSTDTSVTNSQNADISAFFDNDHLLIGLSSVSLLKDDGKIQKLFDIEKDQTLSFAAIEDDTLYALANNWDDPNGQYNTIYYYTCGNEAKSIAVPEDKNYQFTPTAVYDKKLYYEPFSYQDESYTIAYYDAEKDEWGTDEELTKLRNSFKDKNLRTAQPKGFMYDFSKDNIFYMKDKDGANIYEYDKSGKLLKSHQVLVEIDNYSYLEDGFAEGYISYHDEQTNTYLYKEYIIDLSDDTMYDLGDPHKYTENKNIKTIRDGYVYYSYAADPYSDLPSYYYYKVKLGASLENADYLFYTETYPLANTDVYGVSSIKLSPKGIYYLCFDGQNIVWYRTDPASLNTVNTNYVDRHIDAYDYGKVQKNDMSYTDDDGYMYFCYHNADFKVNSSIKNADKINQYLSDLNTVFYEDADNARSSALDECSLTESNNSNWMKDNELYYELSRDFTGAWMVHERYLAIGFSLYEYWGGAHGYTSIYYLYFDTNTGERVLVKDLWSGSEDSFKSLVADKSVENWMSDTNKDVYLYTYDPESCTQEDIDDMYEDFYENADSDLIIKLNDEFMTVMYPPYQYGSYAAGYIDINIPIKECSFSW